MSTRDCFLKFVAFKEYLNFKTNWMIKSKKFLVFSVVRDMLSCSNFLLLDFSQSCKDSYQYTGNLFMNGSFCATWLYGVVTVRGRHGWHGPKRLGLVWILQNRKWRWQWWQRWQRWHAPCVVATVAVLPAKYWSWRPCSTYIRTVIS